MDDQGKLAALVSEQLGRFADRVDSRLKAIETALASHEVLEAERTRGVRSDIDEIKKDVADHETRLRDVTDDSNRTQTILGLSSGGAVLASIAAMLKAFLGP